MAKRQPGFTLIELMVVVAIIGILSTIALPTYQDYVIRGQITEAMNMADGVKRAIGEYYMAKKRFPADNRAAGVPAADKLIGNYVRRIDVVNGAIHISLGNRINALASDKVLTLQPAVVEGSPASPLAWLCGYAEPVEGMKAQGDNRTSLPSSYLSPACRAWREAG